MGEPAFLRGGLCEKGSEWLAGKDYCPIPSWRGPARLPRERLRSRKRRPGNARGNQRPPSQGFRSPACRNLDDSGDRSGFDGTSPPCSSQGGLPSSNRLLPDSGDSEDPGCRSLFHAPKTCLRGKFLRKEFPGRSHPTRLTLSSDLFPRGPALRIIGLRQTLPPSPDLRREPETVEKISP